MAASRYAQILTGDSIWQGNWAGDRSQFTFHLNHLGEGGGSPHLHVAAEVMPYLLCLQREAAERFNCQAGANAPCLPKGHFNGNVCSVNKIRGLWCISNHAVARLVFAA